MLRRVLLLLFGCFALHSNANEVTHIFLIDSIPNQIHLNKYWKFCNGDNQAWASAQFDDSKWDTIHLSGLGNDETSPFKGIGWFRLHLKVSPALFHKTFLLLVSQTGASEIYLNGKLVHTFGKVGNIKTEEPYDPSDMLQYIELGGDTLQVLAVRFSSVKTIQHQFISTEFNIRLANVSEVNSLSSGAFGQIRFSILLFAVFLTVAIFHLLLFLYYRKVFSNLYYSILALLLSFFWLYPDLIYSTHDPIAQATINEINLYIYPPCFFLIILLIYSIFKEKYNWYFWAILILTVFTEVSPLFPIKIYISSLITLVISSSIKGIIMVIKAVRRKQPGAWIIASGFLVFLVLILGVFLFIAFGSLFTKSTGIVISDGLGQWILLIWAFSIPTSMSVYLASDFARTNKYLVLQVHHVKQLSEQNIEKEREKQQIIERQKEVLEVKVKEATFEISRQKDELSEKNKEITDSINYARRIQTSILPETDSLKDALGDHMVIYKPKDVVSGDFYWCHTTGDKAIFAVADCTGHGVPGAFMSMIGNSLLNEIVIGRQITEANRILDELRSNLIVTLQQSAQHVTTRDGMDIALCVWDKKLNTLQFAGANNSLYLVSRNIAVNGSVKESERVKLSNEHLLEIMPDKQPIGYQEDKMNNPFTKNIIQLNPGDSIFISSDGYTDQFGGERNKKFTSKRFRELIASLVELPLAEQQRILEYTIEDWKKVEAQTDDICVLGVRVS